MRNIIIILIILLFNYDIISAKPKPKRIETRLWHYVRNNKNNKKGHNNAANNVLKSIDEFCYKKGNWMMNLGDKKGQILDNLIKSYKPNIVVEVGTYIGYSAIRMSRLLSSKAHLYTIDRDPMAVIIAKRLVGKAGLSKRVTFIKQNALGGIAFLKKKLKRKKIDFLFIDHMKDEYLTTLVAFEQSGLLKQGTVVVADNVVHFADDLKSYLYHVQKSGIYSSSNTMRSELEYSKTHEPDGLEVSIFAGVKQRKENEANVFSELQNYETSSKHKIPDEDDVDALLNIVSDVKQRRSIFSKKRKHNLLMSASCSRITTCKECVARKCAWCIAEGKCYGDKQEVCRNMRDHVGNHGKSKTCPHDEL